MSSMAPQTTARPDTGLGRLVNSVMRLSQSVIAGLEQAQPLALLAARLYVAEVFFSAGLTKLRDWDTTLALFADEYQAPLLSPTVAAWMGTAGELVLPVLLALGLTGRFAAAGLFVVNAVAVLSLAEVPPAALQQHVFWGSLLIGLVLWGPGRWSLDCWAKRRWAVHSKTTA